ncbi:MAG: excinuclease ABC subunit UvrA, partial [bacterium]
MKEESTHFGHSAEHLEVLGARVHNLKNIDLNIPRDRLIVVTGLSGSGKSSLAFDTIYAEGQRRYMETLSAYARQFIGNMERPDVDKINGLSPVISIEQKSVNRNPRSTVGTITELYDFLRLLFARASVAYSYNTGEKMVQYTGSQITSLILEEFKGREVSILSPVVKGRKGHYRELLEQIRQQGFLRARIDGEIRELSFGLQLDRYKIHDIEVVVDRLLVRENDRDRISRTVDLALKQGKGTLMITSKDDSDIRHFSRKLMCPTTGLSYDEPEPNTFSFNSPYGACPECKGLGFVSEVDLQKVMPDKSLSIKRGGFKPLGDYKNNWVFKQLETIGYKYGFDLNTPLSKIPKEAIDTILHGTNETIEVKKEYLGITSSYSLSFEGIINYVKNAGHNIGELAAMDLSGFGKWLETVEDRMDDKQKLIGREILREIRTRLGFLLEVGIDYLNMNRPANSLSGGESQRIRLATQIGSQLTGVLYILDEPSIGLHQRDNHKLIRALKDLRDIGNSIIVVEHDKDTILAADYVIDIGPGAGRHGGEIVAAGSPEQIKEKETETAKYLNGTKEIPIPVKRRKGKGKSLWIRGASGNNLKALDVEFPLGKFICVTGVSGSGKSSLINETLFPALNNAIYRSMRETLPYRSIEGIEYIDKVI